MTRMRSRDLSLDRTYFEIKYYYTPLCGGRVSRQSHRVGRGERGYHLAKKILCFDKMGLFLCVKAVKTVKNQDLSQFSNIWTFMM